MSQLAPGRRLTTTSGTSLTVVELLASDEQGETWRVEVAGQRRGLIWCTADAARGGPARTLATLLPLPPPDPRFLWPLALVADPAGTQSFGCVIALRAERFGPLEDLVQARMRPTPAWRVLATAAQVGSAGPWTCTGADGHPKVLPPGRSIALQHGLEGGFGPVTGVVRTSA